MDLPTVLIVGGGDGMGKSGGREAPEAHFVVVAVVVVVVVVVPDGGVVRE